MNSSSCAVLVLSCDKYSDLWSPFFLFFYKYWKDCPYPVYLGTNQKKFEHKNVKQIFSGKSSNWSEELEIILSQIPEDYILLFLEDYFIYEMVDNKKINFILNTMIEKDSAFIRLAAFPKKYNALWPYTPLPDYPSIGEVAKGSKYRLNLQTSIWKKEILLKLLNKKESPWEFETEASKRSDSLSHPFLCIIPEKSKKNVHGPITYYCTALTHGKWMRGAVKLSKKENIPIDLSSREVESRWEEFKRAIYIGSPIAVRKIFNFLKFRLKI
jgi:hypothetical protein